MNGIECFKTYKAISTFLPYTVVTLNTTYFLYIRFALKSGDHIILFSSIFNEAADYTTPQWPGNNRAGATQPIQ